MAMPLTGGVGLTDVLSTMQNGVRALASIAKALGSSSLQTGSQSTSATAGTASALPATPAGYADIIVNGATVKIPYYLP